MLFSELAIEVVGETGRLVDAAVEGLRSWAGSGWRFMEADWIVEAMSTAGLDILWCYGGVVVKEGTAVLPRLVLYSWVELRSIALSFEYE